MSELDQLEVLARAAEKVENLQALKDENKRLREALVTISNMTAQGLASYEAAEIAATALKEE